MEEEIENTNIGCCGRLFGCMGYRLERVRRRLRKRLQAKRQPPQTKESKCVPDSPSAPHAVSSRTSIAPPEPQQAPSRTSIAPPAPQQVPSRTSIAPPAPQQAPSRTSIAPPAPQQAPSRTSITPPELRKVPSNCSSIVSAGGERPETPVGCTGHTYIRDSSSEDSIVSSSQIYAGLIYRGDSDDDEGEEDTGAFLSFFSDDDEVE